MLSCQGANFDGSGKQLSEALLNATSHVVLPTCFFAWIAKGGEGHAGQGVLPYAEEQCVQAPLYVSTARDRVIGEVTLPSAKHDRYRWTLAGVAVFVSVWS